MALKQSRCPLREEAVQETRLEVEMIASLVQSYQIANYAQVADVSEIFNFQKRAW